MAIRLKQSWWRRILESKFTLAALIALATILILSVYDRYMIEQEMAERRAEKEAELQILRDRKQALQEKVDYLHDEAGVEAEIRKHFDVAREGEQVVILLEDDRQETPAATTTKSEPASGFWSWLNLW